MILNKESEDNIKSVIGYYNKKYATAPVPEHQIVHTDEHNLDFIGSAANQRLTQNLQEHGDNAIDDLMGEKHRMDISQSMQGVTQKQDATSVSKALPDVRFKEQKDADREQFKTELQNDPNLIKPVLNKIAQKNPDLAPQIKSDRYKSQAVERKTDPNTIIANSSAIEKGDLDYNLQKDQLQRPIGFGESMAMGHQQRNQSLGDYKYFTTHNEQDNINLLESARNQKVNPDVPVPTPTSFGRVGQSVGSEGQVMGTTILTALGTSAIGLPEVAPYAAAAVSSPEYFQRGFANSVHYHYNDLRNGGMNPHDAYTKAYDMAGKDAAIDVAQNAVANVLGAKVGGEAVNLTPETRALANGFLAKGKVVGKNFLNFAQESAEAGGVNVGTGVLSQVAKNINAGKPASEGIEDGAFDNFVFPFMLGGLMKVGGKVLGTAAKPILSALRKMPPEVVGEQLQNMKQDGTASDEDIADVKNQINSVNKNDSKIPVHITDEATRGKISDLMDKYDKEKEILDDPNTHDVYKKTVKARMGEIESQINDISGTQPQDNIRTKKIDFDKVAVAKNMLNEDIQNKNGDWTENDINTAGAKGNPELFLKEMAMQSHGIDANGNPLEGGSRESDMLKPESGGYSQELIDAAKKAYPKESFQNKEEVEGVDSSIPKTLSKEDTAPSSIPQHDNISTDKNLRTLDYGDFKGQKEDAASDKQIKEDILNDNPVGKSGEKFSDFIKRSIPAVQKVIEDKDNNSVVVTHSSVLKAMKVWEDMGRPDVNELQGEKLKEFAQKYNDLKPEKEGRVEVLKGKNETATQLVRHGETEDNKISDFREDNTELTDKGMSQAKKSGQEIKRMTGGDVTKIVSSDLPRTIHTSNLIMDEVKGGNLEDARQSEIRTASKPEIPLNKIKNEDFLKSDNPRKTKYEYNRIVKEHKMLEKLLDCL